MVFAIVVIRTHRGPRWWSTGCLHRIGSFELL